MSGASAKKALKASAQARRKYYTIIFGINAFYFLCRIGPGYVGWGDAAGVWVNLRWLMCIAVQFISAMFLVDAESQSIGEKHGSSSSSNFFFDCFGTITAIEFLACIEFWYRGGESIWWLSLILPLGGAYLAYSSFQGSTLSRLMGGGKEKVEEVDPVLAAKQQRRKELKEKRAAMGRR